MIELSGNLGGIGLPAVIGLLSELSETGVLYVTDGVWRGELVFLQGELLSATLGATQGLDALTACVLMLGKGEFTFAESTTAVERNISLTPRQLREYLDALPAASDTHHAQLPSLDAVPRPAVGADNTADQLVLDRTAVQVLVLVDGQRTVRDIIGERPMVPVLRSLAVLEQNGLIELTAPAAVARPAPVSVPVAVPAGPIEEAPPPAETILGVCPKLGYADDRGRHYSRPTALHRCYATDPVSLISSQEQRDFCFGGRYSTCPRFSVVDEPAPAQAQRPVPPGVAARLAAAQNMMVAGAEHEMVPARETAQPRVTGRRRIRGPILIAAGAVIGVIAIVAVVLLLPMLMQPQFTPAQPTPVVAAAPTVQPTQPLAAAPTAAPARPTAAPATVPPRLPTATAIPTASNGLLDIRFANAQQKDWLENPPFAGWRDGAYRLVAKQAKRFVAVGVPLSIPDDVVVSATMRKTGGPPGGGYGVIVRSGPTESLNGTSQTFDGYVLETGDLGEFGIWRREGERWIDLVPWTRSQAVRQGGSPNELAVRATGSVLAFTINGIEVARVDDDALTHGGVGVFAGGDNNEVALDRFTVQLPN